MSLSVSVCCCERGVVERDELVEDAVEEAREEAGEAELDLLLPNMVARKGSADIVSQDCAHSL